MLKQDDAVERLLRVVPDAPTWVDLRGMLLSGHAHVAGATVPTSSGPDCPPSLDRLACMVKVLRGATSIVAAVGRPPGEAVRAAVSDVTDMTPVVTQTENAEWVGACLNERLAPNAPRWTGERMVGHRLRHSAPNGPRSAADVRLLATNQPLDHLPAGLRHEITHARALAPVAAAIVDRRPVSFCYPVWRTEALWDVSIDTLDGYRRRGLAGAAVRFMIDYLRRDRLEPVWCALESNTASLELAAKLGFEPVGSFMVFSRGPWAILTAGFTG